MLLLVIGTVASMAMGCGRGSGGDSSTSSSGTEISTSSLDKEEFIDRAGKACQLARKNILERVLAYTQQHESKHQSRSDETKVFASMTKAVVLPTIEKEIVQIRKLGAPAGDEDELEAFLSSEQEAIDAIYKLPHIVSRFELERYFVPSAKLAREYGLDECANGE